MRAPAKKKLYKLIRTRIRDARLKADLPQKTVAKACGITQAGYSSIETGQQKRVQVWTLYTISRVLKVPLMKLLPKVEW